MSVSIPFKRESLSKAALKGPAAGTRIVSIPFKRESLSKGRIRELVKSTEGKGFNSLQTGKPIQRIGTKSNATSTTIVLFQFPSNGKAYPKPLGKSPWKIGKTFQFPSNGKAYPKSRYSRTAVQRRVRVSIPFKRESLSKANHHESPNRASWEKEFQFPSNGKAYPKVLWWMHRPLRIRHVSIPFKRESLSKVSWSWLTTRQACWMNCFNSLQTGKPIQRVFTFWYWAGWCVVSIPFKRESLSKVRDEHSTEEMCKGFNSLQTGKPIQRSTADNEAGFWWCVSIPFKRESLSKASC